MPLAYVKLTKIKQHNHIHQKTSPELLQDWLYQTLLLFYFLLLYKFYNPSSLVLIAHKVLVGDYPVERCQWESITVHNFSRLKEHEPLLTFCYNNCLCLVQVIKQFLALWVQWLCHLQNRLFDSRVPYPLALKISYSPLICVSSEGKIASPLVAKDSTITVCRWTSCEFPR